MSIELNSQLNDHALKLHNDSLVVDMHSDIHLDVIRSRGKGETRVLERRHYNRLKEAGINTVVLSTPAKFGPDPYPYLTTPVHNFLSMADAIDQEIIESPRCFTQILEADDILRAKDENKIGIILGLEGAEAVTDDLALLRCYYRLGLRIMNLTWHQRNQISDGISEPSNSGLSNIGRKLIKEMNKLGIAIDVAHLSEAGVIDVLELSEQPIIASHANVRALCDHRRNLHDWQIKGIAEKGGLIGVVFLANFVSTENPNIFHVLDHVDYLKRLVGSNFIGIGPDYTDYGQDMIISARRVAGHIMPLNDEYIPYAYGLEKATKLSNFTKGLVSRGYSDFEIRRILGENFLEFFRKIHKGV